LNLKQETSIPSQPQNHQQNQPQSQPQNSIQRVPSISGCPCCSQIEGFFSFFLFDFYDHFDI